MLWLPRGTPHKTWALDTEARVPSVHLTLSVLFGDPYYMHWRHDDKEFRAHQLAELFEWSDEVN